MIEHAAARRKPYTFREDSREQTWVNATIHDALSGRSAGDPVESFEKTMFTAREECLTGTDTVDIAAAVRKLRKQLGDEAKRVRIRIINEKLQQTDDPRNLRRFLEDDLDRLLRGELQHVVNKYLQTITELIARSIYRNLRMFPYCVQVCGAFCMQKGKAIEMLTGEGKTLVGPLVAIPLALRNQIARVQLDIVAASSDYLGMLGLHPGDLQQKRLGSVQMITSNSYLVLRDYTDLKSIYKDFGITTSYVLDGMPDFERQLAYEADVIFGTMNRFGWDFLESFTREIGTEEVVRESPVAIVDEIDHALIDEASTSLQLGFMNSSDTDSRMLVYQVYRFYEELSEATRLIQFDAEKKILDCTAIGVRVLCGLIRTIQYELVEWIESSELSKPLQELASGLRESFERLDQLTDRGSPELITSDGLMRFCADSHRIITDSDSGLVRSFFVNLVNLLPGRFFVVLDTVIDQAVEIGGYSGTFAGGLVADETEHESIGTDIARARLTDVLCRLFAHGVSEIALDHESRREMLEQLLIITQLRESIVAEEKHRSFGIGGAQYTHHIVSFMQTILVRPFYHVLLENYVDPTKAEAWLNTLGEVIDIATREAPAGFSQWIEEIPDEFIDADTEIGHLAMNQAGLEKVSGFMAAVAAQSRLTMEDVDSGQLRKRLQTIVDNILEYSEAEMAESEREYCSQWKKWMDKISGQITNEEDLQRRFRDLTKQVQSMETGQLSDKSDPVEPELNAILEAADDLLTRVERAGASSELIDTIADFVLGTTMASSVYRLAFSADMGSLPGLLTLFLHAVRVPAMRTQATLQVLMLVFLWSKVYRVSVIEVFGSGMMSGRVRGKLKKRLVSCEKMFTTVRLDSGLPSSERVLSAALHLRSQLQDDAVEDFELIAGYLSLLAVGQPISADSVLGNHWVKQALFGYLDELRHDGLLESYDANLASQVLGRCFEMQSLEIDRHYLLRERLLASDRTALDPYTRKREKCEIAIIDQATGRIAINSRWSGLLHEALEAKHNRLVRIGGTHRSITVQALSNCVYERVVGMSGTLEEIASEMQQLYGVQYDIVPVHLPCIRNDNEDQGYRTRAEALDALVSLVSELAKTKRPVLVRCLTLGESEEVYRILCSRLGRDDVRLLNGRPENVSKESAIIANAGSLGSIVVSTQIVGRGVDIKLENPEMGLYVIGFGRDRFRRLDRQFIGRAGRQGDPGDSQFLCTSNDRSKGRPHLLIVGGSAKREVEISAIVSEMQANDARLATHARGARTRVGQIINECNEVFAARRKNLTQQIRKCSICRDHVVQDGRSAGVCDRCRYCLGKIHRSGRPCEDLTCTGEDAVVDYYRSASEFRAGCVWSRVHEFFLDSENPTLLPPECAEAFGAVHDRILTEVADWPTYIVSNSELPDGWPSSIDRYTADIMCETFFDYKLDPLQLEMIERRAALPGGRSVRDVLAEYLAKSLEDKLPVEEDCRWRVLIPPESFERDPASRVETEGEREHLSALDVMCYVSRRLYGGEPVRRVLRDGAEYLEADEIDWNRCIAIDSLVRRISVKYLDDAWDEWCRRVDDLDYQMSNKYSPERLDPLSVYRDQAAKFAERYLLMSQIRTVDALLRLCRLVDFDWSRQTKDVLDVVRPICRILDVPVTDVMREVSFADNPLNALLRIHTNEPNEQELLAVIRCAEPLRKTDTAAGDSEEEIEQPSTGNEDLAAARMALSRHDDAAALQHLRLALESPHVLERAVAMGELQQLLQRNRGADAFPKFCEVAVRERLFPAVTIQSYVSFAKLQKISEDILAGRATGQQALDVVEATKERAWNTLHYSPEPPELIAGLLPYLTALDIAACMNEPEKLRQFCEAHDMHAWADNIGNKCLLPVKDIKDALAADELPQSLGFLLYSMRVLSLSLTFYPDDEDGPDLAQFVLNRLQSDWQDALCENTLFLTSTRSAIQLLQGLEQVNQACVEDALHRLDELQEEAEPLSTMDIALTAEFCNSTGSAAFLRKCAKGRTAYESGAYSTAINLFEGLLAIDRLNPAIRNRISQWNVASKIGRIEACAAFELSPAQFISDAAVDLAELRESESETSLETARLILELAAILQDSTPAHLDIAGTRRSLKSALKRMAGEESVASGAVRSIVDTASLATLDARAMLAEVVELCDEPMFRYMSRIMQGEELEEVVAVAGAEQETEPKMEMQEKSIDIGASEESLAESEQIIPPVLREPQGTKASSPQAHEELKWYRAVLEGIPYQEFTREFAISMGLIRDEEDGKDEKEERRARILDVAVRITRAFIADEKYDEASALLGFLKTAAVQASGHPTESEIEIGFQIEQLWTGVLSATGRMDEALSALNSLQDNLFDHVSNRVAGELTIQMRTLLGDVQRELIRVTASLTAS